MSRFLTSHKVNSANVELSITAQGMPGPGGANHLYWIGGFNTETNPSCPFKRRYGAPADHTTILFQNGAIGEVGLNGITHEALLAILIDRLESFQTGPYKSNYNADALYHLQAAMDVLHRRTRDRMAQGIEGTMAVGKESEAFKVREALEDLDKQERDDAAYDRSTEAQADAQKLKDHWESRLTEARTKTTEWPHDRSTDGIAAAVETASAIPGTDADSGPRDRAIVDEEPILKFFEHEHLPERLAKISRPFFELAFRVFYTQPAGAERSTALRKLLEAKDAAVRAAL